VQRSQRRRCLSCPAQCCLHAVQVLQPAPHLLPAAPRREMDGGTGSTNSMLLQYMTKTVVGAARERYTRILCCLKPLQGALLHHVPSAGCRPVWLQLLHSRCSCKRLLHRSVTGHLPSLLQMLPC
jgi:hypothetical protein